MLPQSDLEIHIDNLNDTLGDLLGEFPTILSDHERVDEWFLSVCQCYRRRGIAALLLECQVDVFHQNLFKSGSACLAYVQLLHENSALEPYHLSTGRITPLFDAIVACDPLGAKEIARLTPHTFSKGNEYEDDFCYFYFLMQLGFLESSQEALSRTLSRFEEVISQDSTNRFHLCKALLSKDGDGFYEAMDEFLLSRKARIEKYRENESEDPIYLDTEGNISIEGLALVRLAEMREMTTEEEYMFIPSLARRPRAEGKYPSRNTWRNVDI